MTADIVAFLNRALDEEAETARLALAWADEWASRNDVERRWNLDPGWPDGAVYVAGHFTPVLDAAAHIARQDPQATLDRVEATKAVVAMHRRIGVPVAPYDDDDELPACDVCWHWPEDFGKHPPRTTDWPCPTLRALASAYRRHPDYDQARLPDGVGVDA